MKIGNYKIEKLLLKKENISFLWVCDNNDNYFLMRSANEHKNSETITNKWFQCYEEYQLKITNYNYLPRPLTISTYNDMVYTLFPYEKGSLLKDVNQLEIVQIEQLLEAIRHLHKKGFVHGNIHEDVIYIRESGDILLFGAGEEQIISSAKPSFQSDYNQLISLIRKYTSIDTNIFVRNEPKSLEEIQEFIQSAHVKPGLIEKDIHTENQKPIAAPEPAIEIKKEVPDPAVEMKEKVPKSEQMPSTKKKKVLPKWLLGIASTLFVFFLIGVFIDDEAPQSTSTTTNATNSTEIEENKPPELSLEQFSSLFPGWQSIKQEEVKIKDNYFTLLAIGMKDSEGWGTTKLVVASYEPQTEGWKLVWETGEYEIDSIIEIDSFLGDLLVLQGAEQDQALAVFNLMHSGNSGVYDTYAIEINEQGTGNLAWEGYGTNIEMSDGYITVYDLGETHLSLENQSVKVEDIPRSEVAPTNAVQAGFIINQSGLVEPAEAKEIQLEVGDVLSFIPMAEDAKWNFDEGKISIYTNLWNSDNPVSLAHAYLLYGGNAIKFTEEGTFEFFLDYYNEQSTTSFEDPPATFVIYVGDVQQQNNEVDNGSEFEEASIAVTTPFQLGEPLTDLLNHYGEPTYDDYYLGGRLVVFDKDGYFLDENENVGGFYIANPSISVFNAQIGMTGNEINQIYGEQVEPHFDDVETGSYVHSYYINEYKIFFHSETPDGPTSSVLVLLNN